jgi:surface polysaccharide O-acyltransferase-like enzyme
MSHPGEAMRKNWVDYLRAVAAFSVVTIHVSGYYYREYGKIDQVGWWLANILNASSRFAVPLYVMVSGCLLLGQEGSVDSFYKKRARRLIPAFVFWNGVYICFLLYTKSMDASGLVYFLKAGFFTSGYAAYFHLWYLPMFICLMMFSPFVNMFVVGSKPTARDMQILILVLFVFSCGWQLSVLTHTIKGIEMEWFTSFAWFIGYYIIGFYIDNNGDRVRLNNTTILLVIACIISAGAVLNYAASDRLNIVQDYFMLSNQGPLVFIFTTMLFLLFRRNSNSLKRSVLIGAISESSFGIYLIHPLYLYILSKSLPAYRDRGMIYMPLVVLLVMFASFVTIHTLRRVRLFRVLC